MMRKRSTDYPLTERNSLDCIGVFNREGVLRSMPAIG